MPADHYVGPCLLLTFLSFAPYPNNGSKAAGFGDNLDSFTFLAEIFKRDMGLLWGRSVG